MSVNGHSIHVAEFNHLLHANCQSATTQPRFYPLHSKLCGRYVTRCRPLEARAEERLSEEMHAINIVQGAIRNEPWGPVQRWAWKGWSTFTDAARKHKPA